jgi:hypothetical protein
MYLPPAGRFCKPLLGRGRCKIRPEMAARGMQMSVGELKVFWPAVVNIVRCGAADNEFTKGRLLGGPSAEGRRIAGQNAQTSLRRLAPVTDEENGYDQHGNADSNSQPDASLENENIGPAIPDELPTLLRFPMKPSRSPVLACQPASGPATCQLQPD